MASRFDEIVADSEDEDMLVNTSFDVLGHGSAGLSPKTAETSIYASNKSPQAPLSQPPIAVLPEATASSSNASQDVRPTKTTAATSRSAGPTVPSVPADGQTRPKPRPRPRPAYKGAPGREDKPATPQAASLAPSSIDSFPSSVAATRLPPPQPSDPIVSSSSASVDKGKGKAKATVDDIESFGMDIAERAKMRTAKKKKPLPIVNDIIELTSDSEDELSLLPPPKPKPKKANEKPKPKPKLKSQDVAPKSPRKKAKLSHDLPDSTPVTIPVPTSDIAPSSQLPPSDPLLPSSAPVPPASTPPPRNNSPPSSPFPAPIRKRKRPNNSVLSDDEDANSRQPVQPTASTSSAILMPPPPPPPAFFASPSPSPPRAVLPQTAKPDVIDVEAEPKKKAARKKKNADDEDEDWDAKPKAKAKPKATKKKVQEDAEEAPTEKSKPPSKAKGRGRKKMEVIVEVTSPKKPAKPRSPSPLADPTVQLPPAEPPAGESSELSALESEHERPLPENVPLPASPPPKKPSASSSRKGKKRAIVSSDEEDEGYQDARPSKKGKAKAQVDEREGSEPDTPQSKSAEKLGRTSSLKENGEDSGHTSSPQEPPAPRTPAPKSSNIPSSSSSSARRTSSIIPKKSNVPMSELLRKVNSLPGSPFASQRPTHSPYMKASKSALRRIAPLLTSRRTPPPPPPRPPPPKKTKKQLELEEKWEMELEESVDGWYCLPEDERAALRRAKRDREMGFDD